MSMDLTLDARVIANDWPGVVGKLPVKLAAVIAAFDEATHVQPPQAELDTETITARNVAETITGLAETLAAEQSFATAKRRVLDLLARRILFLAAESVPELIEQVRPEFDTAAAEFRAAVDGLPSDHSAAALIQAGPGAVEQYHRAVEAQAKLNRYAGWVASIHNLPGFNARLSDKVLRLLHPANRDEYQLLVDAADSHTASELDPVLLAAVEAGIPFRLNSPEDANAIEDEINAMPVEKRRITFA